MNIINLSFAEFAQRVTVKEICEFEKCVSLKLDSKYYRSRYEGEGIHKIITKTSTKTSLFKHSEDFTTKKWKFSAKHSDIFHTSAQNIDCGYSLEPLRRGGSKEYSQSMFLSRNKKNNVYPCKTQFYYIKWGLMGSTLYRHVFVMYWRFWYNEYHNK